MAGDMTGKMPGDFKESKPKIAEEVAQKIKEMDVLIAKTFSSHAGRKVLKFLRDETIEKPIFRRIGQDIAGANEGYFREGQNELIRQLEMRMKRANSS